MKMTKKDIKYGLLFQNKLSSKPGSHMSGYTHVSVCDVW